MIFFERNIVKWQPSGISKLVLFYRWMNHCNTRFSTIIWIWMAPSADVAEMQFVLSSLDFKLAHNFELLRRFPFSIVVYCKMMNQQWKVWLSRVLPYWLTVLAACWTLAYFYFWNAPVAFARYEATATKVRFWHPWRNRNVLHRQLTAYITLLIFQLQHLDFYFD